MKITLVQSDIAWENKKTNFKKYESLLSGLSGKTDVVVLPEMFNTGFSMNSEELAEAMNGETVVWMREVSAETNYAILGSFIASDRGKYYNRLVFMKPDGDYCTYDKGHLFRMEKENMSYTKGNRTIIDSFKDWKFSLQICYDLRFPVWSRNKNNGYDILVYIANWPAVRRNVWNTLLIARAIENQCFVVGVNRIGRDENSIDYCGDTKLVDPRGNIVANTKMNTEEVITGEISLDELRAFREKFPVWLDADNFEIISDR
ncbi:MAG TPA: amidohydrolase [Bacteroidales bacterium]|nr:amidohydrolase [Bacteroidales bacterium]